MAGTIPSEIGGLTSLTFLSLGLNSFTGHILPSIGGLISLSLLDIGSNSLIGPVPKVIGSLTSLTSLDMSPNSLTGTIPSQMLLLTNLYDLELENNYLSMGSETAVSDSFFSSATLSEYNGPGDNCLIWRDTVINPSHCLTTGKEL